MRITDVSRITYALQGRGCTAIAEPKRSTRPLDRWCRCQHTAPASSIARPCWLRTRICLESTPSCFASPTSLVRGRPTVLPTISCRRLTRGLDASADTRRDDRQSQSYIHVSDVGGRDAAADRAEAGWIRGVQRRHWRLHNGHPDRRPGGGAYGSARRRVSVYRRKPWLEGRRSCRSLSQRRARRACGWRCQ